MERALVVTGQEPCYLCKYHQYINLSFYLWTYVKIYIFIYMSMYPPIYKVRASLLRQVLDVDRAADNPKCTLAIVQVGLFVKLAFMGPHVLSESNGYTSAHICT
jgi:hypothetical protein